MNDRPLLIGPESAQALIWSCPAGALSLKIVHTVPGGIHPKRILLRLPHVAGGAGFTAPLLLPCFPALPLRGSIYLVAPCSEDPGPRARTFRRSWPTDPQANVALASSPPHSHQVHALGRTHIHVPALPALPTHPGWHSGDLRRRTPRERSERAAAASGADAWRPGGGVLSFFTSELAKKPILFSF